MVLGIGFSVGLRFIFPFWIAIAIVFAAFPLLLYVDIRARRNDDDSGDRDESRPGAS